MRFFGFLGFWVLSFIIQWIVGLVFNMLIDDYILAMTALPLALCFSLMAKVNSLENALREADNAKKAREDAERRLTEEQRKKEEEEEQKRIEEEMIALVVASELKEK